MRSSSLLPCGVSLALSLTWIAPGCSRDTPAEPVAKAQELASVPAPKPVIQPETPWKFPAAERVVAFGDVHGDVAAARAALGLVGVIDGQDRWIGGKAVLVATGDQTDRGDDEKQVFELFHDVARQAKAAGGAFHVLSGNHEVLNAAGHFDYVSEQGFAQFTDVERPNLGEALARFAPEARGRAAAFLPGGPYARRVAEWPVVVQIGDTVFVHGGILPEHVDYGLGRINVEVSRWMKGELARLPDALRSMSAPFWVRLYSKSDLDDDACAILSRTLSMLGVRRMVMGHTPQKRINSACGEQAWRIDVGLSKFYGPGPLQALEIRGGKVKVLSRQSRARTDAGQPRANVNATAE